MLPGTEFREQQVANAEKAGKAEIAALERAASEAEAAIRESIRLEEVGEVEKTLTEATDAVGKAKGEAEAAQTDLDAHAADDVLA